MKNFKYPLRIKGSFKELIDISKDLVDLGYNKLYEQGDRDYYGDLFIYLVTNDIGDKGQLSLYAEGKTDLEYVRTDVFAKDKDLVLALAAMVDDDKPHVGEYVVNVERHKRLVPGKPYRITKLAVLNDYGFDIEGYISNGNGVTNFPYVRKATKEEIINHFMNNEYKRGDGVYTTLPTGTPDNNSTINILNPVKSIEESVVKSRLETLLLDKPELQDTLAELFPEVISMDRFVSVEGFTPIKTVGGERILELRAYGPHQYKGFWLSNDFDWEIVKDGDVELVLVPTRKK